MTGDPVIDAILLVLRSHPEAAKYVSALTFAWMVLSFVNGMMTGKKLRLLDIVSHTSRRDAAGTWKLPGVASKHAPESEPFVPQQQESEK